MHDDMMVKCRVVLKLVNVIKDVMTRWWSNYAMLERLKYLKIYIQMMVRENRLSIVALNSG